VQRPDLRRKELVKQYAVLSMSDGDGQTLQQSGKIFTRHFEPADSLPKHPARSVSGSEMMKAVNAENKAASRFITPKASVPSRRHGFLADH
jgi:hypothetical protein